MKNYARVSGKYLMAEQLSCPQRIFVRFMQIATENDVNQTVKLSTKNLRQLISCLANTCIDTVSLVVHALYLGIPGSTRSFKILDPADREAS